jgi:hypothetical protein
MLYACSHFNVISSTRIKSSTSRPLCLLTSNLTYATSHTIPLGSTSRLPVHDQAWAYADRLSKDDEIFHSYIGYVPSKIPNATARPMLIASRLRQARYKLTHEPGKAKHVEQQGTTWESHLAQITRAVARLHEAVQNQHPCTQKEALLNFELTAKADSAPSDCSTATELADIALTPPSAGAARANAATHHSLVNTSLPSAMAIPLHGTYAEMQPAVAAIVEMRARAAQAAAAQAAATQAAAAQATAAQLTTAQATNATAATAPASDIPPTAHQAAQPHPSAPASTASAKRPRTDDNNIESAKRLKATATSATSGRTHTAKATAGTSSSSITNDKKPKKQATSDKRKDAEAKKPKTKHATDTDRRSSNKGESQVKTVAPSSTVPASANAHKQNTAPKASAPPPANKTRVTDKAQTQTVKPPHTHNDAQAATTSAANKTKNIAPQLPPVPKRIGPANLYVTHNLHKVDLTAVTDEESWKTLVKPLKMEQENELLDNMATFIFSLSEIDPHIDDKQILKTTRAETAELIDDMLMKTAHLAEIPDFVNPIAAQHDSDSATYHGRGLGDIKNMLDDSALTIWTHLRGALADYHSFITSMSPPAWHRLAIAIVATLTVYQKIVSKVHALFPGHTSPTLAGALPRRTTERSGGSGTKH